MSPQPATSQPPEPTPPPQHWLPAPQAAAILGQSTRHVRRMCVEGRLSASQHNGSWYVDPACAPALRLAVGITAPGPVAADSELAGLTASQRQRAFARLETVRSYQAALEHKPESMTVRKFATRWVELHNAQHPSRRTSTSTLYDWQARLRKSGVAGLVDRRGGPRTPVAFSPECREYLLGLYLKQTKPSIPYIYRIAQAEARERGWDLPALRTVQRFLRNRVDPKLLDAGREPKRFRDRCLPYIKRDWSLVPAMDAWVADHRLLDLWLPRRKWDDSTRREVVSWQRPWLTAFLDCRSWYPVGWILDFDSPNAHRVASCLVSAVEAHGTPGHAILDNGKDFRAHMVAGGRNRKSRQKLFDERRTQPIMEALGIEVHWAIPYNAKAKVIERWFGILAAHFDRQWPTYCGHNTVSVPEQIAKLKAADIEPGYDIAAVRAALAQWIDGDYALAPSPAEAAGGRSPLRAFAELRPVDYVPVRPPSADLAMLLTRGKRVRVERNGVYVHAFGQHYWSDELESRRCASARDISRQVAYRYAESDPSRVWVFDARTDRFLCIANALHPLAAPGSADADKLSDAMAMQRRLAGGTTTAARELRKTADNVLLDAHRRGGEAAGILDDPATIKRPPEPKLRIVDTELTRAAQAGQRHDAKAAARAEREQSLAEKLATGTDSAVAPEIARTPTLLERLARSDEEPANGDRPKNDTA